MKGLKIASLMVVFSVMVFSAKAQAESLQNTQPVILAQAKPAFRPVNRGITPQLRRNSQNLRGLESNSRTEALINEAIKRYESSDYKGAIEICNQVLQIERNNPGAYALRGFSLPSPFGAGTGNRERGTVKKLAPKIGFKAPKFIYEKYKKIFFVSAPLHFVNT